MAARCCDLPKPISGRSTRWRSSRATRFAARPCAICRSGCSAGVSTAAERARLRARNFRRRRHHAVRMRAADRRSRLAGLALDRQHERPRLAASPHRADARQRRRARVGLSGHRVAGLGLRRCEHGAAARPRRIRYRAVRQPPLARRSSVRHSCGRRTLRLSHRERTRPARAATIGSTRVMARIAAIHAARPARPRPGHAAT